MTDSRLRKWAEVLVNYSTMVQSGDTVAIIGGFAAEPLLREISRAVLRAGGHPVMLPTLDGADDDLVELGTDDQLDYISPVTQFVNAETDVRITVMAMTNTRQRSTLDADRRGRLLKARAALREIFMARAATAALRWSLTLFPTAAYAQDADLATDEFADLLFEACKLNDDDPTLAWRRLSRQQAHLIEHLAPAHEVRLVGDETDLRLAISGRTWINSDGKRNFPSGEIFTGPIETSARGTVRFTYPVVTAGVEIADVRLTFRDGIVVDATASRNERYLHQMLDTDAGARRLGEFAFGTNFDLTRFTKNILLDEKIGGTVHMALGAGYPDSGSTNKSAIHWDLICDLRRGGRVEVDGETFLENGVYRDWLAGV